MNTGISAALGAAAGLSLFGVIIGLHGRPVDDLPTSRSRRRLAWPERFDHLGLRLSAGIAAALVIGVLTGWPVGVLVAALGGFAMPSLRGRGARRGAEQARLDAIATWTEQLRDVMAAAAGLEQAIIATAAHAPAALEADVRWLATTLEAGTGMRTALRRFAERLADPAADLVVAALILATEGSPRQVGDLLSRLAMTTRETVKMRLRIDASRSRSRSAVMIVTGVTIVFATGIVILNPTYVAAYRSPFGQLVLVGVAGFFGGAYAWIARTDRVSTTGRFLAAGATAHAPISHGRDR